MLCALCNSQFLSLYTIEKSKYRWIADRRNEDVLNWNWVRQPRTRLELDELHRLTQICYGITFGDEEDGWRFNLAKDGRFHVNVLRLAIDKNLSTPTLCKLIWCKIIPLNNTCFIWGAYM